jgi:hypothetical protein
LPANEHRLGTHFPQARTTTHRTSDFGPRRTRFRSNNLKARQTCTEAPTFVSGSTQEHRGCSAQTLEALEIPPEVGKIKRAVFAQLCWASDHFKCRVSEVS